MKKRSIAAHIIGILKQRKYARIAIISTILFGLLYSFLYGLWQIPVVQVGLVRMSEITFLDVVFLVLAPIMAGMLVTLIKYKMDDAAGLKAGTVGGSALAGFVAAICPSCQGVTFAALGSTVAALPLGFLIPYLWILQIAALYILAFSLYLTVNNIYTKTCPASANILKLAGNKGKTI